MALKETIDAGIKQAMLAKDKTRLLALRSIKSQILVAETAEGLEAALRIVSFCQQLSASATTN